jgi:hypothetical protein
LTAHLHSLADEPVDAGVAFPALAPSRVKLGNFLERDLRDLPLTDGQTTVSLTPGAYVALVIGT